MADIVNLRIARKRARRSQEETSAAAQRHAGGRSKAERTLAAARRDKARRDLDWQRIERGDDR